MSDFINQFPFFDINNFSRTMSYWNNKLNNLYGTTSDFMNQFLFFDVNNLYETVSLFIKRFSFFDVNNLHGTTFDSINQFSFLDVNNLYYTMSDSMIPFSFFNFNSLYGTIFILFLLFIKTIFSYPKLRAQYKKFNYTVCIRWGSYKIVYKKEFMLDQITGIKKINNKN